MAIGWSLSFGRAPKLSLSTAGGDCDDGDRRGGEGHFTAEWPCSAPSCPVLLITFPLSPSAVCLVILSIFTSAFPSVAVQSWCHGATEFGLGVVCAFFWPDVSVIAVPLTIGQSDIYIYLFLCPYSINQCQSGEEDFLGIAGDAAIESWQWIDR